MFAEHLPHRLGKPSIRITSPSLPTNRVRFAQRILLSLSFAHPVTPFYDQHPLSGFPLYGPWTETLCNHALTLERLVNLTTQTAHL